ncbi:M56 family metallopeptidase [Dyella sedimenti]|uniref:M56 family metallopeptidase n=1 Tax=Dyella sedimenti TaxID=2919947 RepID=UPI001FAA3412|nr:M56 family metallopeptidase [Dyella sedimenti]
MSSFLPFAEQLVGRLAWTSLQAAVLVGLVWLAGRLLPRLSPATRSMLWWLLGVQLLLGLFAPVPVSLPLLSSPPAPMAASILAATPAAPSEHQINSFAHGSSPTVQDASEDAASTVAVPADRSPHWQPVVLALWLSGVLVQLLAAFRQGREARRVVRESWPVDDPALRSACVAQAHAMRLRRCPALRVSDAIRSPQVSGLWRPVVLLPAQQGLTPEETALALAHELTHLRRGDLWMGWVPALAQRLFFFHPLVAWAMREYALHREAACDAQVMERHDAAPQDYGRLLLRLGVAHPLHAGLAGASPTFHNLKRRLTLLQLDPRDATSRTRGWLLVAAVAAVGVLPYRVTEARPEPTGAATAPQPAAAASAAAPAPSAGAATTAPRHADAQASAWPSPPPVPKTPPVPPVPPTPITPATPATPPTPPTPIMPPAPPPVVFTDTDGFHAHHVDIDTDDHAVFGFAALDDDSVIVNGSSADLAAARRLRDTGKPLVLFRRGGQAYVIHDAAYVARAKAAYAPVTELAREQGRLGGEQGRLGGQQGAIGAREGALGMRQAALATREATLAMQAAQGTAEKDLAAERASLRAEMAQLDKEREGLAHEQQALGRQQADLGKQQATLGRRQQQAGAQASEQMSRLLDEALAKGVAQPLGPR